MQLVYEFKHVPESVRPVLAGKVARHVYRMATRTAVDSDRYGQYDVADGFLEEVVDLWAVHESLDVDQRWLLSEAHAERDAVEILDLAHDLVDHQQTSYTRLMQAADHQWKMVTKYYLDVAEEL